jgi:hypothetical protein
VGWWGWGSRRGFHSTGGRGAKPKLQNPNPPLGNNNATISNKQQATSNNLLQVLSSKWDMWLATYNNQAAPPDRREWQMSSLSLFLKPLIGSRPLLLLPPSYFKGQWPRRWRLSGRSALRRPFRANGAARHCILSVVPRRGLRGQASFFSDLFAHLRSGTRSMVRDKGDLQANH